MSVINPQFKHFCDECKFLGPYKHAEVEYDLYYCEKKGEVPALFARYGNEPIAFHATADFTSHNIGPALWQARRQARLRGFIR